MYIDTLEKDNSAVDLNYNIWTDEDTGSVCIKFTGFEDEDQIKQFMIYMSDNLPLLLYNSDVVH